MLYSFESMPDEPSYREMQLAIVREVLEDSSLNSEIRGFLEQLETEVVQEMFVNRKEPAA